MSNCGRQCLHGDGSPLERWDMSAIRRIVSVSVAIGDRYRTHRAGRLCTAGDRAAVQRPGSERPAPCRDAEHALARAGRRTADGAQASRYE